jgi:hypothetical protein
MKLYSLSHLIELAALLPAPRELAPSEEGYTPVIRLPFATGMPLATPIIQNASSMLTKSTMWSSR